MKLRYEDFGAIVALDDPPALIHVDQEMVLGLGHDPHPRWAAPQGHLSAPTEVHLMLTNRCPAGCPTCYTDATPDGAEPGFDAWTAVLDTLAEAGVFHVALGGGESALHPDLIRLAEHARARGLVPNLTTSGIGMTAPLARACRVFGQVNVSLDGLDDAYRAHRGYDGSGPALRALAMLAAACVPCGVNYVVARDTWAAMEDTVRAAAERGANQVEFLRFKPAGRGRALYDARALTESQARAMLPRLLEMARAWPSVDIKVDCAFVPFLCAADPDPGILERFGVYGCEAGHVLSAVTAELEATPCSFVDAPIGDAEALRDRWDDHPDLDRWRRYHTTAPAPCRDCEYRTICKGGCKVVTRHAHGDWFAPDPECPRVRAHARGEVFVPVDAGLPR